MKKSYYFYTTFGLLILLGLIISGYIFGWTVPSTTPPGGNIAPPINTGSTNQAKTGYLAVGTSTTPTYPLEVGNQLRVWGQLISKVASGTAPFVVDSPTKVTNLNADLLDGYDSSDLLGGGTVWGFSAPPGNCPPYDDCDGDGYTAFTGDCDETCPTCYVGSTAYTTSPDGKDQDCDGRVDEADENGYYLYDTAVLYIGNLGGRSGADAKCNSDADKPSTCTSEAWAFISVSDADEIQDMPTTKGINTQLVWYFRDGGAKSSVAATNWSDLLDGSVQNAPASGGFDGAYWTGDNGDGSVGSNCSAFTSGGTTGNIGSKEMRNIGWLNYGSAQSCGTARAILCACRGVIYR